MINLKINSQRGVVLIVVMLIFAATTIIVVNLQARFMSTVKAQGVIYAQAQAQEFQRGAELLAGIILRDDALLDLKNTQLFDHQQEAWAQPQAYPIDGGQIRARLIDLQGRFNLAELVNNSNAQQVFINLLQQLELPSDTQLEPKDIVVIIKDWIDQDLEQTGFVEAEDDYYLSLSATGLRSSVDAYRTSQQALTHLSELLLIRGLSAQDYGRLAPYVTLLPIGTPLNINSVSLVVAQALNPSGGGDLVTSRPETGFTPEDMASLSDVQRPLLNFGVESQFFELRSVVELGDVRYPMSSIVYMPVVTDPAQAPLPLVLARDQGWAYYYSQFNQ